ncbi:MAG: helix-turn-helix domain-containing protein, partial [Treponema sp.]|nr:helix-turn-helix domain-containing protein [Treponema sp.]
MIEGFGFRPTLNLFLGCQVNILTADFYISMILLIVKRFFANFIFLWVVMIDIAEELRKIRETTGFSQQKMADLIGIPQRTWSS